MGGNRTPRTQRQKRFQAIIYAGVCRTWARWCGIQITHSSVCSATRRPRCGGSGVPSIKMYIQRDTPNRRCWAVVAQIVKRPGVILVELRLWSGQGGNSWVKPIDIYNQHVVEKSEQPPDGRPTVLVNRQGDSAVFQQSMFGEIAGACCKSGLARFRITCSIPTHVKGKPIK